MCCFTLQCRARLPGFRLNARSFDLRKINSNSTLVRGEASTTGWSGKRAEQSGSLSLENESRPESMPGREHAWQRADAWQRAADAVEALRKGIRRSTVPKQHMYSPRDSTQSYTNESTIKPSNHLPRGVQRLLLQCLLRKHRLPCLNQRQRCSWRRLPRHSPSRPLLHQCRKLPQYHSLSLTTDRQ